MEKLRYDVEHLSDSIKDQLSLLGVNVNGLDIHQLPLFCLNINTYLSGNAIKSEDKNGLLLVMRYLINRILCENNFDNDYTIGIIAMLKSEPEIWGVLKGELYQYVTWTSDAHVGYIYYIHFNDYDDDFLNLIIASHNIKLYSRVIRYSYAKNNTSDYAVRYHQVLSQIVLYLCRKNYLMEFVDYMSSNNQKLFTGTKAKSKFAIPISDMFDVVPPEYDYMKLGIAL